MVWLALVAALASVPDSEPEVLVFAGGWGPESNPVSLEEDADRLSVTFGRKNVHLLFANGGRGRSVQVVARTNKVSARLGLLFGRPDALSVAYRRTRLSPDGSATRDRVVAGLIALTASTSGGLAFGAGHGAPGNEAAGAALELWGGSLEVKALALELDANEPRGPLTLVLGQCHSGAFADLVYRAGDPDQPLAQPPRCVLAAVPRELEAAGCSPDLAAPGARAFLHAIAEGLRSRAADYDRNGVIALDEAFAFARIRDQTIDVPVRSSELWAERKVDVRLAGVLLAELLAAADSAERAVLEALAPKVSPEEVEVRLQALIDRGNDLDREVERCRERLDAARALALDHVLEVWPELANPYHPVARRLLQGEAKRLMQLWEQAPEVFQDLESRDRAWGRAVSKRWALEREIARADRFVRTAKAVLARRALSEEDRARLAMLRACESRKVRSGLLDEPGEPPRSR